MASLLIVRRGGDIVAQCDALCYDARHDTCVCTACGGTNHGLGYELAVINTRTLAATLASLTAISVELDDAVLHDPLFPLPQENPMPIMRDLPTFQEIRRAAHGELGDVLDGLRSVWQPGAGPTDAQADALVKARLHIALARAALDEAARS